MNTAPTTNRGIRFLLVGLLLGQAQAQITDIVELAPETPNAVPSHVVANPDSALTYVAIPLSPPGAVSSCLTPVKITESGRVLLKNDPWLSQSDLGSNKPLAYRWTDGQFQAIDHSPPWQSASIVYLYDDSIGDTYPAYTGQYITLADMNDDGDVIGDVATDWSNNVTNAPTGWGYFTQPAIWPVNNSVAQKLSALAPSRVEIRSGGLYRRANQNIPRIIADDGSIYGDFLDHGFQGGGTPGPGAQFGMVKWGSRFVTPPLLSENRYFAAVSPDASKLLTADEPFLNSQNRTYNVNGITTLLSAPANLDGTARINNAGRFIIGGRWADPGVTTQGIPGLNRGVVNPGKALAINAKNDILGRRANGTYGIWKWHPFPLVPATPIKGFYREAKTIFNYPAGWTLSELSPSYTTSGLLLGQLRNTSQSTLKTPAILVPISLSVDGDHDGVIQGTKLTDEVTANTPYRFWSNDDDDDGDDKRAAADDIPLPEGDSKRDSENNIVDGIRDLEDFFPVYFDIKQLLSVLPPGTNDLAYYLKQEDSALGVVFTSYTRAQAFDYLRGSTTALDTGFGPALTQKAGDATVVKITAAGVNISTAGQPTASPAFFDRIKNNDGGVLLVEASKATTKPLVLEVRKSGTVIAEISLPLKVDPVETMFRYVNLRSFAHGTPIATNNQGPGYGSTTPTAAPNDPFATASNRKNMVFVHGYNVNGEGARGAAATAFKRFYWSGSKAKFYAVLWRGDDGQGAGIAPAGATPDYHRNVGHAWQQGPLFRDFLGTLQGDTAIMAHSLGNGVTKVALTRARDPNNPARLVPASKPATVKHYFAVDSALPLEATSASDITTESKSRMRHSWWAEYDSQERLWPTHWHKLFENTGDGREGLTWQNVFANLEVGTNFYSSGEEVLANPVNDSMPVWEPLFFAGLRAWVAQEKHKGGNGVAASFFRSWTAGWVENEAWYVPRQPPIPEGVPPTRRRFASEAQNVAAPNGVPSSALPAEPFFRRFQATESGGFYPGYQGSRLHAPIGDTNADDEARKLVTVAKCLGEAIPALSYPQGSNTATKFDDLSGNFDLNTSNFKNGWPASRGGDTNWKHSDCLDVSYIFHFKLYDRMKTDGGLQ
jgi:hypothetical protein